MPQTRLPLHEWILILLFCLVLLGLAGYAWSRPKPIMESVELLPLPPKDNKIQVTIKGHVSNPGTYKLPLGATLKSLLAEAQPLQSADLSKLNWRKRLREGQTIQVPERHRIQIELSGAVKQPGPLEILSGTRCCELVEKLEVQQEADIKPLLRKKSFIQEGDKIEVPIKKRFVKKDKESRTEKKYGAVRKKSEGNGELKEKKKKEKKVKKIRATTSHEKVEEKVEKKASDKQEPFSRSF